MDSKELCASLTNLLVHNFEMEFHLRENPILSRHFYFESKDYDFYLPFALTMESSVGSATKKVNRWLERHSSDFEVGTAYSFDADGNITVKS
ncbi:hypothetical protein [Photobacterium sanguinicancri]|uniref:DUF2004 domain-containing protein n=1 Tax=Photobacterium sanguinicancri TaxID=875932 RepID=A0AAW7Y7I8_9GAMM|nr:hypothetical protein [Photobacterium sanguinicancri]MDO6498879.1 hypothetical protein [Photobacterium sanguinicancri]MDO6542620.1 hypothetical protein [Photobacterium sanguinicancri]